MTFKRNISGFLQRLGRSLTLRAACNLTGVEPEWLAVRDCRLNALEPDAGGDGVRLGDGDVSLHYVRAL